MTLARLNAPIGRVELDDPAQGGAVLTTDQSVKDIEEAADHYGLLFARVDLASAKTKLEFLRAIAAALSFPDTFGENWDALYDCLTDMDGFDPKLDELVDRGLVLLLDGAGAFASASPQDFTDACAVLRAAAEDWKEDDVAFWVLIRGVEGADA